MNLKPGKRHAMRLTFEVNEEVSLADVRDFIVDAWRAWAGAATRTTRCSGLWRMCARCASQIPGGVVT